MTIRGLLLLLGLLQSRAAGLLLLLGLLRPREAGLLLLLGLLRPRAAGDSAAPRAPSLGTMQVGVTFGGIGIGMSACRVRTAFVWPAAYVTHQQVWGASN